MHWRKKKKKTNLNKVYLGESKGNMKIPGVGEYMGREYVMSGSGFTKHKVFSS